jgi:hypothetical protein
MLEATIFIENGIQGGESIFLRPASKSGVIGFGN